MASKLLVRAEGGHTVSVMGEQLLDSDTSATVAGEQSADARLRDLISINEEVVQLFYSQSDAPGEVCTPSSVCLAFSKILLRRWQLCCIVIHLRGEDGHLHESATARDKHFDRENARAIAEQLVRGVEREGGEIHVWADEDEPSGAELRRLLAETPLRAAVAIPIHARETLVGALIAVTAYPERLRQALYSIRFITPLIVIAVNNARRALEMREQHRRIEELVTELQQRGRALEEANRELRHVAHYRSLFLARMSHELRTPLTSMLGFAEILVDHEKLTDTQRRFCEKIQSSGIQLQASLNHLVDLSRLEAGQTELFLGEFSLREALRESCAAVNRLAQKQGVLIDCQPSDSLPTIVSDGGKLRQVLYNFFAHAISRSPDGSTVTVRAEAQPPAHFLITIEDEGERLADLSRIFEPIDISAPSQAANSMNELGLIIARRLIDVLGGSVHLDNSAPRGLKVLIELPARPPEH